MRKGLFEISISAIFVAASIAASGPASASENGDKGGCKIVERPAQKSSGSFSSSVTAGNGRVSAHTTGSNGVTVNSGNGSVSSTVTTASGDGQTVVTTSDGNCVIYRNKKED
jgi:hypothetical protein